MRWWSAVIGMLIATAASAQPAGDSERAADEAVLRELNLPTAGPELLQIFRARTPTAEAIARFQKNAVRLKAANYADRLKATSELTKMGPVVRPLLETLLLEVKADSETVGRMRQVLEQFPAEKDFAVTTAAARMVVRDKPPGSLPVLLEFAPYATDEAVRQELQRAINAVAHVDKRPRPELIAALKDANPARRAAAGEALVRTTEKPSQAAIAAFLEDGHPLVRYQIGLALVETYDKRGLPLLIDVLATSPPDRVDCALDLLGRAAGERAPEIYYQGKHNAAEVAAAWRKWHDKHQANIDLAKQLARNELGFTIVATVGVNNVKNKVCELGQGPERTVRWEFEGPRNPVDVQILGANRLLIAEYLDGRITERDFKGEILRQIPAVLPVACQRLSNGHTFIVTRRMLRIVDHDGKDVFTWSPQTPIITATRLRNGQIAVVTGGRCQLLDPHGRELKSFLLGGNLYAIGGNIDLLANGRILVPLYTQNLIVEFDWTGARHWQASVNRPTSVNRLANGNTLVTCTFDSRIIEIDSSGNEVWNYATEGRPYRARRR